MSILLNACLAVLAFAGHIGLSSLTVSGIPLSLLTTLTIVCVWLNVPRTIAYRILPAALLVDMLQPTDVPVTVITIFAAWLVAGLIQKHWFTNHSIASLGGIAFLATVARLVATWGALALASAIGSSSVAVAASWSWRENLLRLAVETCITIGLGAGWRGLQRSFRRSFIYGTG